ncbi:MAG: hypothetical protein RL748_743 [Pseudomonadota bacterium]|jgi:hypothetical protein
MKTSALIRTSLALACRHALQWRLLLIWVILLLLPTIFATAPIWMLMSSAFDHSVYAEQIAAQFDVTALGDFFMLLQQQRVVLGSAALGGAFSALLLSPLLSGMTISAINADKPLSCSALIAGGMVEYGRMLRLLLLALLPIGLALAVAKMAHKAMEEYGDSVVLESQADWAWYGWLGLALLLLVLTHVSVDAARAHFAIDPNCRSAWRAMWRGMKMVFSRPLATLGCYIGISLIGFLLVFALIYLRINLPHASTAGVCLALVFMQVMMVVVAWMRNARLFALAAVARAQQNQA